jgi:hypothetical protein
MVPTLVPLIGRDAAMGTPLIALDPIPPSSRLRDLSSTAFMASAACRRRASLSAKSKQKKKQERWRMRGQQSKENGKNHDAWIRYIMVARHIFGHADLPLLVCCFFAAMSAA